MSKISTREKMLAASGETTSRNDSGARRTVAKLKEGLPPGLSIKAASGVDPEIYIYESIGPAWAGMVDGDSVVKALKQLPANHRRVVVRLNSPGGDVFEGFAIYNALLRHPAEIVIEIDALAASAASVVSMAGDRIRIAANAMTMVHNAWTIAWGNAAELGQVVELLGKIDASIVATYAARTGQTPEDVAAWMAAETWMDAAQTVERGFADEIGQELNVAAAVPADRFQNTPARFKQQASPAPVAAGPAHAVLLERIALARRRLGL